MNLLNHARQELEVIGMLNTGDEMNDAMAEHILHMVEEFSKEGHSGSSASYAIGLLKKLLNFEPLSPLTGEDSEWKDVSEYGGSDMHYQNNRHSAVFKGDDGVAYHSGAILFRDQNGSCWHRGGGESIVEITFPYTPKVEYIDYFDKEIKDEL